LQTKPILERAKVLALSKIGLVIVTAYVVHISKNILVSFTYLSIRAFKNIIIINLLKVKIISPR
jgi:hypothetical protein